jgi:hypothetical protein
MRRVRVPGIVALLLLALSLDVSILSAGAFRFDTDESIVGVRAAPRAVAQEPVRVDGARERERSTTVAPRRIGLASRHDALPRHDAPAPHRRLVVAADGDRGGDPH